MIAVSAAARCVFHLDDHYGCVYNLDDLYQICATWVLAWVFSGLDHHYVLERGVRDAHEYQQPSSEESSPC
jgi:hypothetical protein